MVFSSGILGMVAVASAYLAAPAAGAENQPLPWDGRGYDLTDKTIETKYLTHILTMRNNTANNGVEKYVAIKQLGRSPAYNDDTGVINIAVDAHAIFKDQTNFRRTELVQFVETNAEGSTFFRASLKKEKAFYNNYEWQCLFTESHNFEIRVNATASPPTIMYLNNGTWEAKWETTFELDTWYNFGIDITKAAKGDSSVITFYMSTGDDDLVQKRKDNVVSKFASMEELHIGLLTLSNDKSQPKMAKDKDIISFNGVSVEKKGGYVCLTLSSWQRRLPGDLALVAFAFFVPPPFFFM
ncbi:unnamed protein product [Peronospora farinosa]|uniref:Glycoside hydrolase 131 catalytic N-terminal domain-containing protein n=1 Tax=Peronospora farinosa TaxID=134698 RepID=A0ABN8CBI1_9STRA|nr:unnamed protein product [Peronospora farinosa]